MKRLTLKKLQSLKPCQEGIVWYKKQGTTELAEICKLLIKDNKLDDLIWLLPRMMKYKGYVSFAVYAAEQVIDIFEKKHPDDDRPRKAINAAKACTKRNSKKNRKAAAYAAAYSAYSADSAYAAAYAAAYSAAYAAYSADSAASASQNKMQLKIARYGMKILKKEAN